ncbi:LmbU family transcriptional regulator [Streptomyces sp. Je 1-369]|uniref:LmbU family transcriptional regulator n=1 Tax=Streptomyces sp. Je 1-369 TaxID=2966192 RepID=UPI0022861F72|nr:LmbU family transcriptional regulator [Streptomyces sp. Je 1-369]WAL97009.1 LmbU family transcriptional regulator [Streptomyces sp. Je 1-369]
MDSNSAKLNGAVIPHSIAESAAGGPLGLGVQFHKSGLVFTAKQSLVAWEKVGVNLFSFANSSAWWIADWLVYGESTFHDRYVEATRRTSLSYQTLRNYTWVAREFPLHRRRQNLSFSHHLEVVALEKPQQDYWLRKAEELGWSRNKLRGQIRSSQLIQQGEMAAQDSGGCAAEGQEPEACLLNLELSAEDLEKFQRAATKESAPVETWAAEMLRRAAAEL